MINKTNRSITKKEGVLNIVICCFGVKAMCRCRKFFGVVWKREEKKAKLKKLSQWAAEHPEIPDADLWKKNFELLITELNSHDYMEVIKEFYECELQHLKFADKKCEDYGPIVLCAERNEIKRMPEFLNHYRKLGVKCFLITDNGSSDGTLEYLMAQPDVELYRTENLYNSRKKTAWQNRMMAEYGLDKWYLQVDADEFAWYPEASKMSFPNYVSILLEKKIYAVKGMMLLMYPRGIIGGKSISEEKFREEYCYFDKDSDNYEYDPDMRLLHGGFLKRVLGDEFALQTKTPLFFCQAGRFIRGSHNIFPLYEDIASDYRIILQHYKFLPGDESKIREAIERGNYANQSKMYKKYIQFFETEAGVSAFFYGSVKWDDKKSTDEFSIIKRLDE